MDVDALHAVLEQFALAGLELEAGVDERGLDLVGRQVRVLLQQERDRAGRHRRGLGGAAAAEQRVADASAGNASSMSEPGARRLTIDRPGATTSGRRVRSPRLEKSAMKSSPRVDGAVGVGGADRDDVRVVRRVVEHRAEP